MPRLDRLPQINRNNLLAFPAQVNDTSPFARPSKPLSALRLAIVTTAGLHLPRRPGFSPGDQTYRVIPSDAARRTSCRATRASASTGCRSCAT
jgi:D-proline reductase (dithiol) PrdB